MGCSDKKLCHLEKSLMINKKTFAFVLLLQVIILGTCFAETLEENWNDFLHYIKIGRLDLAKGYGRAIIESQPDPVEVLALSEANQRGYSILLRVQQSSNDPELVEVTEQVLEIVESGKFLRRTDPKVIWGEIERLMTSTQQGRIAAVKRLRNSGEYAIMHMVQAMADTDDEKELANLIWGMPQIGRDAIRPLVAALQTSNVAVKTEIIKALGEIGYPQTLAYLKLIAENSDSLVFRGLAVESLKKVDPSALTLPAAHLFYVLAENYYYHAESLAPAEDADFANVWFWDNENQRLYKEEVDRSYFYELMAMRCCEWALKADPSYGKAIGLWQAAFFKAESADIPMPEYFGLTHADAAVYATTAGAEYLHQALSRAIKDENAYVALGCVEALATIAGEKSLFYRLGVAQPLLQALNFNDKAVKYSSAIAIGSAGPKEEFGESGLVVENLAAALGEKPQWSEQQQGLWTPEMADEYALRAANVMLKLAQTENPVIDLSAAREALIKGTKDDRDQIKVLSGQTLAHLKSPEAQRAITAMAFNENNMQEIRISAFNSLATSAKFNANLLDLETIDALYDLVSSQDADPYLRSAAAAAFGALNLPSEKVKDLILDQAKI
jgi:HEAT repeat protein